MLDKAREKLLKNLGHLGLICINQQGGLRDLKQNLQRGLRASVWRSPLWMQDCKDMGFAHRTSPQSEATLRANRLSFLNPTGPKA